MGFWLKKIIGQALMPTPVFLMLFFVGLMLLQFTKKKKLAMGCLWTSFILIFLSFWPAFGTTAVGAIEDGYDQSILDDQQGIAYISVLGHGHTDGEGLSANAKLSDAAVKRLVEGIRLINLYPEAKLIVTGYEGFTELSHDDLMYETAISLGVEESRIIRFSNCLDTDDEANKVSQLVGDETIALVSEASHLRRATYLYKKYGTKVVTSAADRKSVVLGGGNLIFNSRSLQRTERAWYEFLGNIWVRLRS